MSERIIGLRTFTSEGRKAEELWYMIMGYSDVDAIDIEIPGDENKQLRVVVMHGEWEDILFWNEDVDGDPEVLENRMEQSGFDKDFYYYFLVGPVSEIEECNWSNSHFYTDKGVIKVIEDRGILGNHMQVMPDQIYDISWQTICEIYEST